jgi:Kef-type K+ transport system membrane component KefB
VALANNGSGITALYVLLCVVGWALFLIFAIRPVFVWILRRNGSLQNGPTQAMVALTLVLVLISSWFTGIIGVHPIFGGMSFNCGKGVHSLMELLQLSLWESCVLMNVDLL